MLFNLDNVVWSDQPGTPASASNATIQSRKFGIPFQGGFDGMNPAIKKKVGLEISASNTSGLDCSGAYTSGSVAYSRAIALLGDADQHDINLLLTPGIIKQHHPNVITSGITMCETRGDCFYEAPCFLKST